MEGAQSTCPFCGDKITQEQLLNGEADIEHLVPRSVVDCNEFFNLTVGHLRCNREIKGDRTPFQAFAHTGLWPQLRDNAEKCFKGRKLEIFLSDKAEELRSRGMELLDRALGRAGHYQGQAMERGRELAQEADVYVKDNPYRTLAVAAGIGVLLGVLLSRKQ